MSKESTEPVYEVSHVDADNINYGGVVNGCSVSHNFH